jgi:hypothetical protein
MKDRISGLGQIEEDFLINGISDEALEVAAATVNVNASYTLGSCTGISVCPGWQPERT